MPTIPFLDQKIFFLPCCLIQISPTCQKTFLSLFWLLKKTFFPSLLKLTSVPAACTSLEHPSLSILGHSRLLHLDLSCLVHCVVWELYPADHFPFLGATNLLLSKAPTQPRQQQPRKVTASLSLCCLPCICVN